MADEIVENTAKKIAPATKPTREVLHIQLELYRGVLLWLDIWTKLFKNDYLYLHIVVHKTYHMIDHAIKNTHTWLAMWLWLNSVIVVISRI